MELTRSQEQYVQNVLQPQNSQHLHEDQSHHLPKIKQIISNEQELPQGAIHFPPTDLPNSQMHYTQLEVSSPVFVQQPRPHMSESLTDASQASLEKTIVEHSLDSSTQSQIEQTECFGSPVPCLPHDLPPFLIDNPTHEDHSLQKQASKDLSIVFRNSECMENVGFKLQPEEYPVSLSTNTDPHSGVSPLDSAPLDHSMNNDEEVKLESPLGLGQRCGLNTMEPQEVQESSHQSNSLFHSEFHISFRPEVKIRHLGNYLSETRHDPREEFTETRYLTSEHEESLCSSSRLPPDTLTACLITSSNASVMINSGVPTAISNDNPVENGAACVSRDLDPEDDGEVIVYKPIWSNVSSI